MSNGDVEGKIENEPERNPSTRRAGAGDFALAVSRISVAQICESVGFQGFRDSALDALVDIAIRYLCDLGKTSSFYANLAGRTQSNLFDVIRTLEDLGASQGFSGASETGNCLVGSGTVREMIEFVGSNEEIPFAQPVPRFPILRSRKMIPSFLQMGETPPNKHIPTWLPAFPDPHTYIRTPMWNERVSDPRADKIEQARQRRKAERALLSLQQRLVSGGSLETSVSEVTNGDRKELANASNQYLVTPLQSGKKEVSAVVLPVKLSDEVERGDHVSVMEAFAPAIEAMKGGFNDDAEGEKNFIPEKRPAVHFKFRTGKKFLGESSDLTLRKKTGSATTSSLLRDEERDDKKRRVELILRQSKENPQELTQL